MFVEVFAEAGAGFFGVDEADGDTVGDEIGEDGDEGFEAFATGVDVEVLEVGGGDPEELLCGRDGLEDDPLVDLFVEKQIMHGWRGEDSRYKIQVSRLRL